MDMPGGSIVPKSFWERREGWGGAGMIAMLISGTLGFFYFFGGAVVVALENLLTTLGLLIAGLALSGVLGGMIVLAYLLRFTIIYAFQSIARRLTQAFIEIDPIGIQRTFVQRRKRDQKTLYERMGDLKKAINRMGERVTKATSGHETAMAKASKARKEGASLEQVFQVRQGGRLQHQEVRYKTVQTKMEGLYRFLKKLYDVIDFKIRDMEAEVELAADERAALHDAYSAYSAARSALVGNPNELALFEMAQQVNADQVSAWEAEIEHFMDMSERFMQSVDVENGIIEAEGLTMLEDWEAKLDHSMKIFGVNKQLILAEAADPHNMVDLALPLPRVAEGVPVVARPRSKWADQFKR